MWATEGISVTMHDFSITPQGSELSLMYWPKSRVSLPPERDGDRPSVLRKFCVLGLELRSPEGDPGPLSSRCVMVNICCLFDKVWRHLGGQMSVKRFPDWVNWDGRPVINVGSTIPRLAAMEKQGESERSPGPHPSWLTNNRCHVTSCLMHATPSLPSWTTPSNCELKETSPPLSLFCHRIEKSN